MPSTLFLRIVFLAGLRQVKLVWHTAYTGELTERGDFS